MSLGRDLIHTVDYVTFTIPYNKSLMTISFFQTYISDVHVVR